MDKKRMEIEFGAHFGVKRTPEQLAERKRNSARWGHVTRRLMKDERLTGDLLEFVLNAMGDEKIKEKLKNGEPLTEYEKHLMLEV